ncbi:MAG: hypothetical protein HY327_01680 [Chloroflexi bacterium]|nr:hypothetical protein [Chloroflexota bacterium]
MSRWNDLGNLWNAFKEIDIRPLREQAEHALVLAIAGAEQSGKTALTRAFRSTARARERIFGATIELPIPRSSTADPVESNADLTILVLDATRADFSVEAEFFRASVASGKKLLVFYNKMDALGDATRVPATLALWRGAPVAFGSAIDPGTLENDFIPRVMEALADHSLALARQFPVFRTAVARELISDSARVNGSYAFGTGLAEIIPALNIPFSVADVVILTKNQALMVYKLGLALGLSTRWQDHVAELGGAVGAGFLWRQVARELVGLIPVWGILPKVAVAYAGTYALGEAILYWYKTGKKISGQGLRELYSKALARGKQIAQELVTRAPRLALPGRKLDE